MSFKLGSSVGFQFGTRVHMIYLAISVKSLFMSSNTYIVYVPWVKATSLHFIVCTINQRH